MRLRPRTRLLLLPLLCGALLHPVAVHASSACPSRPTHWLERPIAADCLTCWQSGAAPSPRTLVLDWIIPADDDAALAVAALPEAAQRFSLPLQARTQALPAAVPGVTLAVDSGLAWHGYMALTFELRRPRGVSLPRDAAGWVALVERIPAGEDGSPVERNLVRAVAGPFTLPLPAGRAPLQHVVAVRLPENTRADRLGAVGWIEQPDGRLWLAAESPRPGCGTAKR